MDCRTSLYAIWTFSSFGHEKDAIQRWRQKLVICYTVVSPTPETRNLLTNMTEQFRTMYSQDFGILIEE